MRGGGDTRLDRCAGAPRGGQREHTARLRRTLAHADQAISVRFYMEFDGTLVPDVNQAGIRAATQEYNTIEAGKKTADRINPLYEEPYDERA